MLELIQIPVWTDNYAYLVRHGARAFVVDAPEAGPVLERLAGMDGVRLEAVVNTHHHPDHVGGNVALVQSTGCEVVGPARDRDRIPGMTRGVDVGSRVEVAGVSLRVLDVRAHTRGHIAYACDQEFARVSRHGHDGVATDIERLAGRPALFVGDSLFLGGCGRLFEGTPTDLHASMKVLAGESSEALVCCAHEYTASNLAFAEHVLPSSDAIRARRAGLGRERAGSGSSVPDTLARELETNPFLLALRPEHRTVLGSRTEAAGEDAPSVLGALRSLKDTF